MSKGVPSIILSVFRLNPDGELAQSVLTKHASQSAAFVEIAFDPTLSGSISRLLAEGTSVRVVGMPLPTLEQMQSKQRTLMVVDLPESWMEGTPILVEMG